MSMRITPTMQTTGVTAYERINRAQQAVNTPKAGGDQLQISHSAQSSAQVYKAAQKAISTTSPEYLSKVNSVADRIKNGTYHVSSGDVASSIIDDLI